MNAYEITSQENEHYVTIIIADSVEDAVGEYYLHNTQKPIKNIRFLSSDAHVSKYILGMLK